MASMTARRNIGAMSMVSILRAHTMLQVELLLAPSRTDCPMGYCATMIAGAQAKREGVAIAYLD